MKEYATADFRDIGMGGNVHYSTPWEGRKGIGSYWSTAELWALLKAGWVVINTGYRPRGFMSDEDRFVFILEREYIRAKDDGDG